MRREVFEREGYTQIFPGVKSMDRDELVELVSIPALYVCTRKKEKIKYMCSSSDCASKQNQNWLGTVG
jgi:hypothetical protein